MIRISSTTLLVLAGLAAATPLLAAPVDTIRTRIAGYRELGAAFKAVNDGLRSGDPQPAALQAAAQKIRSVSQQQYRWFPAGSGAAPGVRSKARSEIWTQGARFKAAQDAFAAQAIVFERASRTGNVEAIGAEARKLGGTCKGCHDNFRASE